MSVPGFYAAMFVTDIGNSSEFYSRILEREPDDKPLATFVQWRESGGAGVQLLQNPAKAGSGVMTIVVPDLDATKLRLHVDRIELSSIEQGEFGKSTHRTDPDGNIITFTEPSVDVGYKQALPSTPENQAALKDRPKASQRVVDDFMRVRDCG